MPAQTQLERAEAITQGLKEVRKEQAKRRVSYGLKTTGILKGQENSEELRKIPAGSQVLVYRNASKTWEGPFIFVNIEGEKLTVQLPHGRKIFRSTAFKPVGKSSFGPLSKKETSLGRDNLKERTNIDEVIEVVLSDDMEDSGIGSFETIVQKKHEWQDLVKAEQKKGRGIFKIVDRSSIPKVERILGTRWIDEL